MLFKKILFPVLLLIFALVVLTGCESDPSEVEDYIAEAVLYGFLTTDSTYGDIKLQRVAKSITQIYDPADHVISSAYVRVFPVLDVANDSIEIPDADNYIGIYEESDRAGTYVCTNGMIVQGGWLYRVEVRFDDENKVEPDMWAETTAPSSEAFLPSTNYPEINDQLDVYPDDLTNLPLNFSRNDSIVRVRWTNAWPWTPNDYNTDPPPGGFYLSILALSDTSDMIPLDPDWDPDDPDDELETEDYDPHGWTIVPNYQEQLDVVWLYFDWAGPQRLDVCAISYEYYRYLFTSGEFEGGPSNVVRPEYNVHGGLGVFGGLVRHSFFINMERQELD